MIWLSKSSQFQLGGYCYIDENLKAVRNIPAHNDAFDLKSSLRGNYLLQISEALKSGLKISGSKRN